MVDKKLLESASGEETEVEKDAACIAWYQKEAKDGVRIAMKQLALMYEEGINVPCDYKKALQWYGNCLEITSEEEDVVDILCRIGEIYSYNLDDEDNAFLIWKKLAERGDMYGQYKLGLSYHLERGTSQDNDLALYWWKKGALQGHESSKNNYNILLRELGRTDAPLASSPSVGKRFRKTNWFQAFFRRKLDK